MDRDLLQKAGRLLSSWGRTMILSHVRPDGDGLGAMGVLKRVIESAGRKASAYVYDEIPKRYLFLNDNFGFATWQTGDSKTLDGELDGIVIVDTCSWSQLGPAADYLRKSKLPKLIIDHHATNDDLVTDGAEVLYVIDSSAASTCEIVYALLRANEFPIDPATAEALFAGIATDTGWFQYSNTNSRTMLYAADLLESGISPDKLYADIYASSSLERLRLVGLMLNSLELHAGGALAVATITQEMLDRSGAKSADTEELVNEPLAAKSVVVSVLLSPMDQDKIRVNLRSKSPEVCGHDIDVSALAKQFGGGGHRRAAGARIKGDIDEVRQLLTSAILTAMNL